MFDPIDRHGTVRLAHVIADIVVCSRREITVARSEHLHLNASIFSTAAMPKYIEKTEVGKAK